MMIRLNGSLIFAILLQCVSINAKAVTPAEYDQKWVHLICLAQSQNSLTAGERSSIRDSAFERPIDRKLNYYSIVQAFVNSAQDVNDGLRLAGLVAGHLKYEFSPGEHVFESTKSLTLKFAIGYDKANRFYEGTLIDCRNGHVAIITLHQGYSAK
jgi:hypothetical protein